MAQRAPVSVVSAGDLIHSTNDAELEAFIASLLSAEDVQLPDDPMPSPPEPTEAQRNPKRLHSDATSSSTSASGPQKKKRSYKCAGCGAVLRGHKCVAFRPHEGRKRRGSSRPQEPRAVSTDSLLASTITPEGKYDLHRLDAHKLKRFTDLLLIWRVRTKTADHTEQTQPAPSQHS